MEKILELVLGNPTSAIVFLLSGGMLIFYWGKVYQTVQNMRENMLTKNDLIVALADFKEEIRKEFVSVKTEIPLPEHIELIGRVKILEEKVNDLRIKQG